MELKKKEKKLKNDLVISYLDNEKKDKKTLVFVHGWGADKYNLHSIFNNLTNDFRIISIDLPGFGDSSEPKAVLGSNEYAEILYIFLNEIKISKINYIGHSFGGKIGILLSINYPNLIKRLVLIDSSGLKNKRNIDWYIKVGFYKLLKFIALNVLRNESSIEKLKNTFGSSDYKNAGNMRNILVKTVNEDLSSELKKINCPVFLYWGEKDKDTPIWMAKKMKKEIKDSALYTVKNGSHFSFLEDNRIISIIKAFAV